MPNLEHLRKRAKLYVRWHRAGYHPAAARIGSVLTRYRHLSDRQILARPFRLCDAQELVARESGFESWEALTKGIHAMTAPPTRAAAGPTLLTAEPQLFVSDIPASCAFYAGKLGFTVAFTCGNPPFYAQIVRNNARLNLRHAEGPVFDAQFRARTRDALSATVTLDDARPLFLEFQNAGVAFHQTLRTEPWGARGFIVGDPDGNLVAFAGRG